MSLGLMLGIKEKNLPLKIEDTIRGRRRMGRTRWHHETNDEYGQMWGGCVGFFFNTVILYIQYHIYSRIQNNTSIFHIR